MSDNLPEGWVCVSLAEVVDPEALIQYGILQPGPDVPDGVPYVRPSEIRNDRVDVESLRRTTREIADRYSRSSLKPGDVILSIVGSIGKVAVVPPSLAGANITQSSARLRPRRGFVSSEILELFLRSPLANRQFDEAELGTGVPRLNIGDIRRFLMPVPPLAEQRRIIAKVEELLAEINAARDGLAKVRAILKRFRQSVLAAACSGKLTEEWRNDVTIQGIALKGIALQLERHRQAWEAWRDGSHSRARAKYVAPAIATRQDLPDLPDTWSWVRFGLLGENPLATVQTGPFGAMLHRDEFVEAGVPVIAVGNLTGLGFTKDGLYYVTPEKAKVLSRFNVNAGDLLFARSGATLGKVCVAPEYVRDWRMTGHILRGRLFPPVVLPTYAAYAVWGAPPVVDQVTESIRGVTRPGYNTGLLEEIHLPLPPLEEQKEIVRCAEALFSVADTIEMRVIAATARPNMLTRAILAKAFRGQLVRNEADLARAEGRPYESAAVLLERITAERACVDGKKTKPRRTRRRVASAG